jgi:hypothetical protein
MPAHLAVSGFLNYAIWMLGLKVERQFVKKHFFLAGALFCVAHSIGEGRSDLLFPTLLSGILQGAPVIFGLHLNGQGGQNIVLEFFTF